MIGYIKMNIVKIFVLIIFIMSITKSFGDNESIQNHNIEDTEDEPIYINHKYFGDESMGSIQKYEPGRVQIKVYRGPDITENDETYAAHGYWIKQPSEDY